MPRKSNQPPTEGRTLTWLLVEMLIYGVFVFAYYLLVLHFLNSRLKELFDAHRTFYAVAALLLIVAQAALLESLGTVLFRLIRARFK